LSPIAPPTPAAIMPDDTRLARCPRPRKAGPQQSGTWRLFGLLPSIVLWHQDNIFSRLRLHRSWLYLGYFRNLVEFKRTFSLETRSALTCPGYCRRALPSLFAPLAANYILHLGAHTLASVSLFLTLKWGLGRGGLSRPPCCSPEPVAHIPRPRGTIRMEWHRLLPSHHGPADLAALAPLRRLALTAAGMALAATVYSDAKWVPLAPLLPLCYLGLTRRGTGFRWRVPSWLCAAGLARVCFLVT